jgi:hypothetical protein
VWRLAVFFLAGGGVWLGVQWGPVWTAAAGGAGVAFTALVTWLLGRRRESGTVETSDASTLWAEAREIMRDRREENAVLRERIAVLEQGRQEDRARIRELEDERREDRARISDLEDEVGRLKAVIGEA